MQITIDPNLRHRISKRAGKLGISFAEFVRRAAERELGAKPRRPDINDIIGIGASKEKTNIARDKHAMIAEATGYRAKRSNAFEIIR